MNLKIYLITYLCVLCINTNAQNKQKDNIVGSSFLIQSQILNDEREIQFYLPNTYHETNKKYPVLYILDGQRYFLHGVSLQKSFTEFKQTPEFIIVGISKKQSDRNRNFSSNSKKHSEFIEKEVINYVDTKFRTSKKNILFGWAYAGGFVIQTMTSKPELFDAYIAASPFPLSNKIQMVDSLISFHPNFDKLLYFTSGTNEGVVQEGTYALNTLLTNKAPKTMNWTFRKLKGEEHRSTPFTTLYHGIKQYFSYYPKLQFNTLEEFSKAGGLDHVKDYYKHRATKYGFPNELSDWTMFSLTRNAIRANDYNQFNLFVHEFKKTNFLDRLSLSRACLIAEFYLKHKQYDKAIDIFTPLTQKHPESERPLNGLENTYKELKNEKQALKYHNKAKEVSEKKSNR